MRIPVLPLLLIAVLCVALDCYLLATLRRRCRSRVPARLQLWSALACYILLIVAVALPRRDGDDSTLLAIMWMLFTFLSIYAAKAVYVLVDLLAAIPRLFGSPRCAMVSRGGAILAVIVFLSMWWGALINRFHYRVVEVTVHISGLPASFDGYRIVQLSDLHVGTYGTDTAYVSKVVEAANALHPDLIVFTGDIVNRRSSELRPFVTTLSRLSAPDGVMCILGNHDYGDYFDWPDFAAKKANMELLHTLIADSIGWRLLLNEHETLRRGSDSLAVIGVENIGDPPFHSYGSLRTAYPDVGDHVTKILLTHNPAHWTDSIAGNARANIALSLSGHTHAMQMSVGPISPAAARYKTWGGLYGDDSGERQLYVNIGIGTVGMPMRLGATPEITLVTLRR